MKRLWLLLAVVVLGGSASGQAVTGTQSEPPVTVSQVKWGGNLVEFRTRAIKGPYATATVAEGVRVRTMSVTVANSGSLPIESIRLAFVFSDPETGKEWFRYKVWSKKRLLPGESRVIETAAVPTLGSPPRDQMAAKSAVIMEIKYSDGSVWRRM